jgi:hypothetical protein
MVRGLDGICINPPGFMNIWHAYPELHIPFYIFQFNVSNIRDLGLRVADHATLHPNLTRLHASMDGITFFRPFDYNDWVHGLNHRNVQGLVQDVMDGLELYRDGRNGKLFWNVGRNEMPAVY